MIRLTLVAFVLVFSTTGCSQTRAGGPGGAVGVDHVATGATDPATGDVPAGPEQGNVDLPRYPSISPDGRWIVFSWRGDLWKVSSGGGQAVRLTTHSGDDLRSAFSPDGKRIAFESDRDGYLNLYIVGADGTGVRQVTQTDRSCRLAGFESDGDGNEVLMFHSYRQHDQYSSPRPYMVSVDGGDILRVHDAFGAYADASPDGKRVVFTRGFSRATRRHYRGPDDRDIWIYDREDGSFDRLTKWEGNDDRAAWADDDTLLYLSDRELECVNLWTMPASKGERKTKRLTAFADNDVQHFGVSADGATAVLMVWDTLYTLALDQPGAQPVPLTIHANEDENDNYELKSINREISEAALSPDGEVMAMVTYGEVYVRNIEDDSPTRRVTTNHAREKDIAWSPDGLKLYFTSDRDGTESIYAATVTLTRSEVKEEFDKAINPPEEEEEEEDKDEETEEEEAEDKPAAEPEPDEPGSDTPPTQPATEPEPKVEEPGSDTPKTDPKPEEEEKPDADKDKGKDKDEKEEEELPKEYKPERWHDAMKFKVDPVIVEDTNDREPSPSPDGKYLAFRRGRGDLMLLNLETEEITTLATGWDAWLHWRWSPDSRHIAYARTDLDFNSDIWVVPVDGSAPAVNITRHPDNDESPRWSADGKILAFTSERVNEEYDVWMVYLDKDLEALTPKELEEYYDEAVKAAKKREPLEVKPPEKEEEPEEDAEDEESSDGKADEDDADEDEAEDQAEAVEEGEDEEDEDGKEDEDEDEEDEEEPEELDLDDAYLRLRRVTTLSGSETGLELTPGGDRYIFNATIGKRGLYSIKWDGEERKRLSDAASVHHVSLTGDKVILVKSSRAGTIKPAGNKVEYVDISDRIRIDLQEQASQKFLEAARILGEMFYHPTMKGLDWEELSKKYHALARQTRTAGEFVEVGMRLLGELNGSHLGIYQRGDRNPNAQSNGRLGTVNKRVEGGFEVLGIVPESPADKGPMALKVGDVITAIEQEPFAETDTVESRLKGRSGKETLISIRRVMDDGEPADLNVLLTPINYGALGRLEYQAYRRGNAKLVDEVSGGKLGYIHIESMGQASLDIFERDLYAASHGKKGLIIDVRNNGGGWTADRLLSSIMVQEHAYTVPRGADWNETGHYPQDRLFIQRYTLPINMLCNEKSFSNAEIIAHAFKTLKRGTLVGQQTYGGVISTGGTSLIDGTFLRLPFRGWFVKGGADMENNGAVPDIIVPQTPEAESADNDEQLRAAVKDLLKRID